MFLFFLHLVEGRIYYIWLQNCGYCAIVPLPYGEVLLSKELTDEEKGVQGRVMAKITVEQLKLLDEYVHNVSLRRPPNLLS
jgi:hypothetical protein